ncbi:holo-ACP synthase [Candidatus Aminicenantes bacterium AH-873-B07]|nr:holo-ACP synthase [Candidatus Aminicenantes bacterium AH-873-B07]
MSIKGIGIDIIEVERIAKVFGKNKKFLFRIFTQKEINYCLSKKNKYQHLAARFAAKEAFFKAFGKKIGWKDIEIINQPSGKPELKILNPDISFKKIYISLSHLKKYAIALVIIE